MNMKSVQQRRDRKRRKMVDRMCMERAIRKARSRNMLLSDVEREDALNLLRSMDRDSSVTRVVNRCVETGRGRGVLSRFRRTRHLVRDRALNGELPGVKKASL